MPTILQGSLLLDEPENPSGSLPGNPPGVAGVAVTLDLSQHSELGDGEQNALRYARTDEAGQWILVLPQKFEFRGPVEEMADRATTEDVTVIYEIPDADGVVTPRPAPGASTLHHGERVLRPPDRLSELGSNP